MNKLQSTASSTSPPGNGSCSPLPSRFPGFKEMGNLVSNMLSSSAQEDTTTISVLEVDSTDALPERPIDFRSYSSPAHLPITEKMFPSIHATLTHKDSESYNLTDGERLLLVFNHNEYHSSREIPPRAGTEKDMEAIRETFEALDFNVEECQNFTASKIEDKLCSISELDNLSCLIIFISTHGEEDGILYGFDRNYRLDRDIVRNLLPESCPVLAGKPKLVFIQACQGDLADDGAYLRCLTQNNMSRHAFDGRGSARAIYRIPTYTDLLIYTATYPGQFSFRSNSGSWFIQAICKEISAANEEEDLISTLTRVSRCVALEKTSNVPDNENLHDKKQVPHRQDTLIRKIYLKPRTPESKRSNDNSSLVKQKFVSEPHLKKKDNCDLM